MFFIIMIKTTIYKAKKGGLFYIMKEKEEK